jgi:GNAT superfamily N-acetyltransferase
MYAVEEITADWTDELVADVNAFENLWRVAADPEVPPMPASVTRTHLERRGYPVRLFVARNATGSVVGSAWVEISDKYPAFCFATIATAPSVRRTGVATTLLDVVVDVVAATGRLLMLGSDDTQRAAEGFAASLGAAVVNRSHINRCVIADVDREMMQGWVDNVHPDYALEWITPDGPYPDASLDDMARLRGVLLNDAPVDDMPIDHRVISHEELRADEARQIGYGRHRWTLIARHLPTGEPVGYTELLIDTNDPHTVYQGATAVDGAHRGHSLGRQLKAAMFQRLVREQPEARYIRTFNADSNAPMLAVNQTMGFKPLFAATRWLIETEDARTWVDKRK